jgi:hypothetical protein
MHKWLGLVVLLAGFGIGCDDDTGTGTVHDMAVPIVNDLSVKVGTKNCLAVATCVQACNGTASCIANCIGMGTLAAQTKFQALSACGIGVCTAPFDAGGSPACSSAMDTSAGCVTCITNATQSNACGAQFQACLTDM